jgi:hypothetical protein
MSFYMASIEFKARDDQHAKAIMKALRETLIDKATYTENDKFSATTTVHGMHIGYYKSLD